MGPVKNRSRCVFRLLPGLFIPVISCSSEFPLRAIFPDPIQGGDQARIITDFGVQFLNIMSGPPPLRPLRFFCRGRLAGRDLRARG